MGQAPQRCVRRTNPAMAHTARVSILQCPTTALSIIWAHSPARGTLDWQIVQGDNLLVPSKYLYWLPRVVQLSSYGSPSFGIDIGVIGIGYEEDAAFPPMNIILMEHPRSFYFVGSPPFFIGWNTGPPQWTQLPLEPTWPIIHSSDIPNCTGRSDLNNKSINSG